MHVAVVENIVYKGSEVHQVTVLLKEVLRVTGVTDVRNKERVQSGIKH